MWRGMMGSTHNAPNVIPIAREKERVDKLVECNELLEAIQKGLSAYLEKKRLFFPRWACCLPACLSACASWFPAYASSSHGSLFAS